MDRPLPEQTLDPTGFSPFTRLDGERSRGWLVLADHASAALPEGYGSLGLGPDQLERHIAYDIGIKGVATALHGLLNVPVVMAEFSRLLIDPNRGEEDPTLIMRLSDGAVVPGNREIEASEAERRKALYYRPYHQAIDDEIDRFLAAGITPRLLSLHSFTDDWRGMRRPWHAGVLWDEDERLVAPLLAALRAEPELVVGDNEPYTGRLEGDCMNRHGTKRGLPHALLEIRQDLIADEAGQQEWAERIVRVVGKIPGI